MKVFQEVINTVEFLRSEKGCPWDRAQTLESYKKYIIEEVYELFDAIDRNNLEDISEELGDLFLNILLMATILKELGGTTIEEILKSLNKKLISRHPHVFGEASEYSLERAQERWFKEKRKKEKKGLFSDIPLSSPSLVLAYLISKRAEKVGFGFDDIKTVLNKVEEEKSELLNAIEKSEKEEIREEIGDLLLAIVNLSLFLNIHPEESLRKTCLKFLNRLRFIEDTLEREGKNFFDVDRESIEKLWEQSK